MVGRGNCRATWQSEDAGGSGKLTGVAGSQVSLLGLMDSATSRFLNSSTLLAMALRTMSQKYMYYIHHW